MAGARRGRLFHAVVVMGAALTGGLGACGGAVETADDGGGVALQDTGAYPDIAFVEDRDFYDQISAPETSWGGDTFVQPEADGGDDVLDTGVYDEIYAIGDVYRPETGDATYDAIGVDSSEPPDASTDECYPCIAPPHIHI